MRRISKDNHLLYHVKSKECSCGWKHYKKPTPWIIATKITSEAPLGDDEIILQRSLSDYHIETIKHKVDMPDR